MLKLMSKVRAISSAEVFHIYRNIGEEFDKWVSIHGQEKTERHFFECEAAFQKRNWIRGEIKVKDLYTISMFPEEGWIRKLACKKVDCKNHNQEECVLCGDPEESKTPTLEKVVKNYRFNSYSCYARKIAEIRKAIQVKALPEEKRFAIIFGDAVPYVFDGNNRLIAMATDTLLSEMPIRCYLGYKKL